MEEWPTVHRFGQKQALRPAAARLLPLSSSDLHRLLIGRKLLVFQCVAGAQNDLAHRSRWSQGITDALLDAERLGTALINGLTGIAFEFVRARYRSGKYHLAVALALGAALLLLANGAVGFAPVAVGDTTASHGGPFGPFAARSARRAFRAPTGPATKSSPCRISDPLLVQLTVQRPPLKNGL